jgi:ankyrin repeat protein
MYHIEDAIIVECLLRHGADVNATCLTGKTALQYASSEAVKRLLHAEQPHLQNTTVHEDRARQAGRDKRASITAEGTLDPSIG